mgnify:CR=1 FL=1
MRGRKPKPSVIHKLHGNPSKLDLAAREAAEVKPDPTIPTCPDWLDGKARSEWRRVCPELARLGLLTKVDRAALAGYCDAYAELMRARQVIILEGQTYRYRGRITARPEVKIAQAARLQVKAFCAEFGLTPSSRARMAVPGKKDEEEDPLEKAMAEANCKARKVLKNE